MKVEDEKARRADAFEQVGPVGLRRDMLVGLSTAVLAACVATIPLIWSRCFYFADDFQTFFMPMFLEIASQLKSGVFPVATHHTWYGGAILAEYQFAVFNPVSLLLYVVISGLPSLEQAAAVYALVHVAVLAGGIYALCRGLRIDRLPALTGAVAGSTSMWVIYWGAQTWICALVGIAWLPWALFFLLCAYRDGRYVVPAALATALAFVSGWPYTIVALGVAVAIGTGTDLLLRRRIRPCARVMFAAAAAAGLAAPAVLPLWNYLAESTRLRAGLPGELQADLYTLIAAGVPIFPDVWRVFGGAQRLTSSPPMQYASWFIPAVLVNADWRRLGRERPPAGVILALLVVAFGAMSTFAAGWHFRMPFRLLPDYHIALAILSAWLLTQAARAGEVGRVWPLGRTLLVVVLPLLIAVMHQPAWTGAQVQFLALIGLLVLACRWAQSAIPTVWPLVLLLGHVVIFAMLTAAVPENGMVAHWTPPISAPSYEARDSRPLRQITLFQPIGNDGTFGEHRKLAPAFWDEIGAGNTTLYQRVDSINGYSAVQPRGFQDTLCFDYMGASCPEVAQKLFAREPATGVPVIDLLRIDRIVAQKGLMATSFAREAGASWQVVAVNGSATVFTRRNPLPLNPTSLSVVPPAADIALAQNHPDRETYRVKPGHPGGLLVWARPWYPGLRVSLNGRNLAVRPLLHLLPAVELPPGQGGKLVITYVPAGLDLGFGIAAAAAAGLLAYSLARVRALADARIAMRPSFATSRSSSAAAPSA